MSPGSKLENSVTPEPCLTETILSDEDLAHVKTLFSESGALKAIWPLIESANLNIPKQGLCVERIKPLKHNPGRRCVIEFIFNIAHPDCRHTPFSVIGKSRAKGVSSKITRLNRELPHYGFHRHSADRICIPTYIGWNKQHNIWFYQKALGEPLSTVIGNDPSLFDPSIVADIAYKIHHSGYPAWKSHTIEKELQTIESGFKTLTGDKPQWRKRLAMLFELCLDMAAGLHPYTPVSLHRDFYADQIIKGDRYFIIDFDLYAEGDPALDIGNFNAHLREQALRESRNPDLHADSEQQIINRYDSLSGALSEHNVEAYTWLSLVRHIYISQGFNDRAAFLEPLFNYCYHGITAFLKRSGSKSFSLT